MADKKPFEQIFPYFSYRWRYNDGQYSPYAPFTKVQFVSKDPDVTEYFKQGHNTSISNKLNYINLKDIPTGGPDVVAVDILYKESISSTVYILQTKELPVFLPNEPNGKPLTINFKISKRSFGSALPNDQLSRHFDNVPRKAKAQEITANRLMYGNYVHKYDITKPLKIQVEAIPVTQPYNGPSVKTNRDYEIGVAYLDKYGRVGNLLTQQTTEVPPANAVGEGSSFTTDFSYKNRISLQAKILDTSPPPPWAKYYRYYVKDVSGEHRNLTCFNVYNDGSAVDNDSDNVYIQLNSSDRNKIDEESILIPRRYNFNGVEKIFAKESKHPVLEIENEAPSVVLSQVVERSVSKIVQLLDFDSGSDIVVKEVTGQNNTPTSLQNGDTVIYLRNNGNDRWFTGALATIITGLNSHIQAQGTYTKLNAMEEPFTANQVVDCTQFEERLVLQLASASLPSGSFTFPGYSRGDKSDYVLIDEIALVQDITGGNASFERYILKITLGKTLDNDFGATTNTGLQNVPQAYDTTHFSSGFTLKHGNDSYSNQYNFYKLGLSDDGKEKMKGSFFVKIPREVADNASIEVTGLPTGQTPYDEDGKVETDKINQLDFETVPIAESNLDLYWEDGKTRDITQHGEINRIEWANCIASKTDQFGSVYLESTRIFDKFNSVQMQKGTRVTTPEIRYAEERRKTGLIFSGLYNSKTGINELNQFNMSLNPTKELEPNYGGIQKLYTLDTNLLALTEDKVFRILADKDALFNADDGVNVTATNLVLGQAMVYQGNYGISTHPESFTFFQNNAYFADAKRGSIIQLTPANGQMFPVSSLGMSNFFRDRIGSADKIIGAYDGTKKMYVVSMQGYNPNDASIGSETIPNETSNITLGYSPRSKGWSSRYSFIPQGGVTMGNQFYTFYNGKAYLHNSDSALRNNFYGTQYNSDVQIIFNDNPTYVSDFLTINYEGDSNWEISEIIGDQDGTYGITNVRLLDQDAGFLGWFLKEGKYHGAVVGTQPVYVIDPNGTVGADGFWPLIQDGSNTQDVSGTKGFFVKARLKNDATTAKEIFAVSSEYYISQT